MSATYGPGYAALYSTLLFLGVIIISFFFNKGGIIGAIEGGVKSMFLTVLSYLPYILIAYGFTTDLFTLEFRGTIASLIGVHAIILCVILSYVFGAFVPMFVVSSASILTYYTFDYLVKFADVKPFMAVLASLIGAGTLLAQTLTTPASAKGTDLFDSAMANDGMAAVVGIAVGLSGWLSTYASSPKLLPYSTEHFTEHMDKKVKAASTH